MLTLLVSSSWPMRRKCAFINQYKNGSQKLLLSAVHVNRCMRPQPPVWSTAITMKPSEVAAIVFVTDPRNRSSKESSITRTYNVHRRKKLTSCFEHIPFTSDICADLHRSCYSLDYVCETVRVKTLSSANKFELNQAKTVFVHMSLNRWNKCTIQWGCVRNVFASVPSN